MNKIIQFLKRHFVKIYYLLLIPFYLYGFDNYLLVLFLTLPIAIYFTKRWQPTLLMSQIFGRFILSFVSWGFFGVLALIFFPHPIITPNIVVPKNFHEHVYKTYAQADHKKISTDLRRQGFKISYSKKEDIYSAVYIRKEWVLCSSDYHISWKVLESGKAELKSAYHGSACV